MSIKNENLTRLLDSIHRVDPRVGGASPPKTFPWCCTNLQRLKEVSLKHLTFKTVFLLAFVSGKRLEHQTPVRLVQGVSLPLIQLSFKEEADQRKPKKCGPGSHSSPGPNSG